MRVLILTFLLGILPVSMAVSAAEDCPPAAEVAELQNPNLYKDCDYSNEGLNGILHRAFAKKKEEDANSNHPKEDAQSLKSEQPAKGSQKVKVTSITQTKQFKTVGELAEARASLVWQQLSTCKGTLRVSVEQYRPAEAGYELLLTTECQ